MNAIKLHPLKKLEIILEGAHKEFATDLLDRAGVKGYTIVGNLSGKGSHGMYEGHLMFNEDDALIMIIVAVPQSLFDPLLEGFQPFFEAHAGVIFVSDIQVGRPVKFMA
ncbi:MAG: transcriptional regulator [Nitrobacter sp. 62-13]|jgi:nitrogen regulatory protein PII|uniref:P-II family nitrogen regulator n=1 Tax=Nitrobacter sp. 62-13 TaxID=1895797 RepID=UPI00095E8A34|nr:P-II family nitrogen regulator [Nitrobacter sp. 62-13]OJU26462.1 MAG: transcriptional regulator [Nitrobacter sp. 62-13]HVT35304.1 P-II family nitrogen regulator [Nevskiaceae bacterium]